MKFKTVKKIHTQILPKYPDDGDFCCKNLQKAMLSQFITLSLSDNLTCKLNVNTFPVINYCPFCGTKFEFEELE